MLFTNVTRGPGATTVESAFLRSPLSSSGRSLLTSRRAWRTVSSPQGASLSRVTSPDSLLSQCKGPEDLFPPSVNLGLFIIVESVRWPLVRSLLLPVGRGVGITDVSGDLFQLTPKGFQAADTPLHQALLPVCIILHLLPYQGHSTIKPTNITKGQGLNSTVTRLRPGQHALNSPEMLIRESTGDTGHNSGTFRKPRSENSGSGYSFNVLSLTLGKKCGFYKPVILLL